MKQKNEKLEMNNDDYSHKQRMMSYTKDELVEYLMIRKRRLNVGLALLCIFVIIYGAGCVYLGTTIIEEKMYTGNDMTRIASEVCEAYNVGKYTGGTVSKNMIEVRCEHKNIHID